SSDLTEAIKKAGRANKKLNTTTSKDIEYTGFNVWDNITSPKKLHNKALDMLGVKMPSRNDYIMQMAKSGFKIVKDKAVGYLKDRVKNLFGDLGKGSTGNVKKWIAQAIGITVVPMSWADSLATISTKE